MTERTVEELEGSYRLLCGAMLLHTARLMSEFGDNGRSTLSLANMNQPGTNGASYIREIAHQRQVASQWVDGGGAVPFDDCCTAVGVDPDLARQKLGDFVRGCGSNPDRSRRFVTGRHAATMAWPSKP